MTRRIAALVFVLVSLVPGAASAQAPAPQPAVAAELVLRDGSRLYGSVEQESAEQVVFRTTAGVVLTAHRDQIVSLRKVEGVVTAGEFQPADPNNTRLFFGPTGRSLQKGQTYLGMYEFLMPFIQVGVTDRFSIGGGTPLVFGFDESERPFWLTPKFQVLNTGSTQLSVGAIHAFAGGEGGGVAYAVVTSGNTASSVTAGGGLAYTQDGGRAGVFMLGGDRAVRRNLKFVSESYVTSSLDGVISAGVRFFGERLSADLAMAVPFGGDFIAAMPVVNFVYLF